MYRIIFKPAAQRQLAKLPKNAAERIAGAIDGLSDQPRPSGCRKLTGSDDLWRIRVGDYRIIYQIEDDRLLVIIIKVGHRREVYD